MGREGAAAVPTEIVEALVVVREVGLKRQLFARDVASDEA
jgi:hypothetical protein